MVSSLYYPHVGGGAEIILREHVNALKQQGVEISVLCIGPHRGIVKDEVDGVRVWRAGIKNLYFHYGKKRPRGWRRMLWHALDIYNPFMKSYIRQVVEIERPDVASCHNITGWSIAAWDALTDCGVPIVQVLHDQYLLCARSTMFRDKSPCSRQCLSCRIMRLPHAAKSNQVRAVVGVSQFIRDKMLTYGYFRDAPIKEFIHNARSFPFDPAVLAPRSDDGNIVFGFIGSLAPNKGVELLLQTFSCTTIPNWRLVIAGTGEADYDAMLRRRFTDDRISFLGHCYPKDFFTSVDATVVPSLWEDTFPGVVFESMLFGVPVVGSQRGGIPEMIVPGETGILFDPNQQNSLLGAMQHMVEKIDFFRNSKNTIIQQVAKFKDQNLWTDKWLNVYGQAASVISDNSCKTKL